MRLRALRLAAASCLLLPLAAHAETTWLCGLSADLVRLVCVADADPRDLPAEGPAAGRPTAVVNGTRFPLDPSRPWTVDLWSPPTERDRVELLARSTICYRSPGCTVSLAWPQDLAAR